MDIFVKPTEHYRRKINLVGDYLNDCVSYLCHRTGDDPKTVRDFVLKSIGEGNHKLQMPQVAYFKRQPNGDRVVEESQPIGFLRSIEGNHEIMSPSMTTYMPSTQRQSILGAFIEANGKKRSAAKKAMFAAKADKRMDDFKVNRTKQETLKISNNSLSGGQCSASTPLVNLTGHSTLTSTCRTATSYANANNERFLSGNRHYYNPLVVKANIVSIITHSDFEAIQAAMDAFGLSYPSADQCFEAVMRSASLYWTNAQEASVIRKLIESLTPLERAAYLYTGDLFDLAQCNEAFVRGLLDRLAWKASEPDSPEEAMARTAKVDGNLVAFISLLCAKELSGKGIGPCRARAAQGDAEALRNLGLVSATIAQKTQTVQDYAPLINAFWITDNLPPSIYALPSIVRKSVLTSDTDSTIFTSQHWVQWHRGRLSFDDDCVGTCASIVYLVSQLVKHVLAVYCGNLGVEPKKIFHLNMKNEFYFPIFTLTSRAKHYFAYVGAQEGLVNDVLEPEIKGVALRSSAIPRDIMALSKKAMMAIMDTIMAGKKVSVIYYMRYIATMEREILKAIAEGSFAYYKKDRINPADAYKNGDDNAKFLNYALWEEVFAPDYGSAPEPPYMATKITLTTDTRRSFLAWIESIEDKALAERLTGWAQRNQKLYIGTVYLPTINLMARGVPKAIAQVVDTRSLISQMLESFYLIMESLGIFIKNKKITRLFSDDVGILSLPEGVLNPVLKAS